MFGGVIDGTDGVAYELRTSVDTLTMPSGATSATFAFKASCYSKSGNAAAAAYPCYFSVYRRTGTSLVYATRYASKVSSRDFSISNVACTVDAIVVFATDTLVSVNASAPTTYVAKCEMAVLKDAPYYVDEYARSIQRTGDGFLYSKIDSSTGTSSIDNQPGWTSQAPIPTDSYPYIWRRTALYTPSTNSYGNFAYVCLTGEPGEPGAAGKTGRMFYLAGSWDGTKTYERNDSICPIVEHDGSYWYLDANSSTGDTPNDNSTVWKKCENFGVVLTEALFADFGKLSQAIISGNYMFSMNGRLFNTDILNGDNWLAYPAYTYFSGDPYAKKFDAILKNFSVTTSWTSLHDTIYLAKDELLVMRLYVENYDTTGFSVAFFDSGNSQQAFQYWNGSTWVDYTSSQRVSVSYDAALYFRFVAPRSGYYRMRAITSSNTASVYAYINRILFEPAWWVNLKTGKSSDAKGAFVASGDSVKIDNLYKSVCICWGSTLFRTLETDGTTCMYVYIKRISGSDVSPDTPTLAAKYGLSVGDYYKLTEEMIASGEFDDSIYNTDFVPCVGKADIVCLMDSNTSYWPDGGTVYFPRPEDFKGKTIEVRHNTTLGTGKAKITTVSNKANGMAYNPYLDMSLGSSTFRKIVFPTGATAAFFTYNPGQVLTFYSDGSHWIRLSRAET